MVFPRAAKISITNGLMAGGDGAGGTCGACGRTDGAVSRCGGCGLVSYCSRDCQKAHWKAHKKACRAEQARRAAAGGVGTVAPPPGGGKPWTAGLLNALRDDNMVAVRALIESGMDVNGTL